MCIIIFKPGGVKMPSKEILNNCKSRNPDGIGYMVLQDNQVYIRKGFWTVKDLLKSINNNVQNSTMVDLAIHFRFSTHGVISPDNCHPFPMTQRLNDLRAPAIKCRKGIMHNGIVPNMAHSDTKLSDTMIAIKTLSVYPIDAPEAQSILSTGKFLIFDAEKWVIHTHGHFTQDNGVYYSNDGYKRRTYYDYSPYEYESKYNYKPIYNRCLLCEDPTAKSCMNCNNSYYSDYHDKKRYTSGYMDISNG